MNCLPQLVIESLRRRSCWGGAILPLTGGGFNARVCPTRGREGNIPSIHVNTLYFMRLNVGEARQGLQRTPTGTSLSRNDRLHPGNDPWVRQQS